MFKNHKTEFIFHCIFLPRMKAGDLVALFTGKFRLSVAIDSAHVILIYEYQQIEEEAINQLITNINLTREDFSMMWI